MENNDTEKKEIRCPKCEALLADGQLFCSECGEKLVVEKNNKCTMCGAEIQEGNQFCSSCGNKIEENDLSAAERIESYNNSIINEGNNKNKTNKIVVISVIVAAILLIVGFIFIQNKKAEEYEKNAKAFGAKILISTVNLENIGNEIISEWHDSIWNRWSIYDDIDEAIDGALRNKAVEVREARSQRSEIEKLYSKLRKPANNTDKMAELNDAIKSLYDEYDKMYDVVITPSGSYNSFSSQFKACDSSVVDALDDLNNLLE